MSMPIWVETAQRLCIFANVLFRKLIILVFFVAIPSGLFGQSFPEETPNDTLPAFFAKRSFFQIALGVPISGSSGIMEDRMRQAGFNKPGYLISKGRTWPFPRVIHGAWVQLEAGALIKEAWAAGLQFGLSNGKTVQGNMDTSKLPRIMVLKLDDVHFMPFVRRSLGNGFTQYKFGLGVHRVTVNSPVVGVENRGQLRYTVPAIMGGVNARVLSIGNATIRASAEIHLAGAVQSGSYRINAGAVGNANELIIPAFQVPLSHLNLGLKLEFGQP